MQMSDERMQRPDHKAKKHGRPLPLRYKREPLRVRWPVYDAEMALIEMSRLQRRAGVL